MRRATSIEYAIRGLPQRFLIFLPGRPLLPPRAGITTKISSISISHKKFSNSNLPTQHF